MFRLIVSSYWNFLGYKQWHHNKIRSWDSHWAYPTSLTYNWDDVHVHNNCPISHSTVPKLLHNGPVKSWVLLLCPEPHWLWTPRLLKSFRKWIRKPMAKCDPEKGCCFPPRSEGAKITLTYSNSIHSKLELN